MKYTVAQFLSYVQGWLGSEEANADSLSMSNMLACLNNTILSIDDPYDGIEEYVENKKWKNYRFDGKYVREFKTDKEAFEYALGFHDDRSASVEKWIDGRWLPASSPVYHPQYYRVKSDGSFQDGGWIKSNNQLIDFDS